MRHFAKILCSVCFFSTSALADVTSVGDVTPTPAASGGNINGTLAIGEGGTGSNAGVTTLGTLNMDGGTSLNTGDTIVGNRLGAIGVATVSGTGTQLFASDDIFVGNDGYGELFIRNRGLVGADDDFSIGTLDDARGWVDVDGATTILNVGDVLGVGIAGTGTLAIADNARVISDDGLLGGTITSLGTVTLTDRASWRIRSELIVGAAGVGNLEIRDGALLENARATMTTDSSGRSQAVVSGTASLWLTRDDLNVGDASGATVRVEDRGTVQVADRLNVRRRGQIMLDDGHLTARTISNAGAISGGGIVDGAVTVTATGSIRGNDDDQSLQFGAAVTNAGVIDVIGGEIEFLRAVTNQEDALIGGHDGVLRFGAGLANNGTLGFSNGTTDIFGDIDHAPTGTLRVGGEGVATFYGDVDSAGAITIEPKASAVFLGTLSIAAEARVTLAGLAVDTMPDDVPTRHDPLSVAGQLEVNGSLDIIPSKTPDDVTDPTEPGTSTSISLVNATELAGAFSEIGYDLRSLNRDFPLADGRSFRSYDAEVDALGMFRTVSYHETGVELVNYLALGGDTDGDQDVDFADFLVVSENFAQPGDWVDGDFDGDGQVQFSDFLALSTNFGVRLGSLQSVPEPSGLSMLCGALVLIVRRRRF